MKKTFENLITIGLGLGAILVLILVYNKYSNNDSILENRPVLENWEKIIDRNRIIGSPDSPIQIIKFYDYQCQYCADLENNLNKILSEYPEEVAISYINYPVLGDVSTKMAISALCSSVQGNFKSHHNWLYKNKDEIFLEYNITGSDYSNLISMGNNSVKDCIENELVDDKLTEDLEIARELKISSTPTILVNGVKFVGLIPLDALKVIINETI
ncbi:hypothetical protein BH23THE1_BH23THE1_22590 [soil metagenome]